MEQVLKIDGVLRDAWREDIHGKYILHGKIYDDAKERFPDGLPIRTSYVKEASGNDVFVTRNSVYRVENWVSGPDEA